MLVEKIVEKLNTTWFLRVSIIEKYTNEELLLPKEINSHLGDLFNPFLNEVLSAVKKLYKKKKSTISFFPVNYYDLILNLNPVGESEESEKGIFLKRKNPYHGLPFSFNKEINEEFLLDFFPEFYYEEVDIEFSYGVDFNFPFIRPYEHLDYYAYRLLGKSYKHRLTGKKKFSSYIDGVRFEEFIEVDLFFSRITSFIRFLDSNKNMITLNTYLEFKQNTGFCSFDFTTPPIARIAVENIRNII